MLPALALIVIAALWRLLAVQIPALSNFAPLMALTFCGGAYFSDRRLWIAPFLALTLSDLYLDYHYATTYGETWLWTSALVRLACFAAALPLGRLVAGRRNLLTLLSGSLAASLLFYFVTNTDAWLRDPHYLKSAAGWWQALTVGRPEFPPTLFFFRNTLLSDLLFTGLFAGVMELAARAHAEPARR
jgi:hypothetical protein